MGFYGFGNDGFSSSKSGNYSGDQTDKPVRKEFLGRVGNGGVRVDNSDGDGTVGGALA